MIAFQWLVWGVGSKGGMAKTGLYKLKTYVWVWVYSCYRELCESLSSIIGKVFFAGLKPFLYFIYTHTHKANCLLEILKA